MISTLLAILLLVQDPPKPPETKPEPKPQEKEKKKLTEAEELLKKIEEKATKAKSLRYKSKVTLTDSGKEIVLEGEGSLKADKFKITTEGDVMGKAMKVSVVCDGKKMHLDGEGAPMGAEATTADAPKGMAEGLRLLLVRVGGITMMVLGQSRRGNEEEKPLQDLFEVSDVKLGKDEKVGERNCKVLEYSLTFMGGGNNNAAEAKLWVDAETLAPVKREITGPRGESFSETFGEWKLDEEMKDELFDVPKEK